MRGFIVLMLVCVMICGDVAYADTRDVRVRELAEVEVEAPSKGRVELMPFDVRVMGDSVIRSSMDMSLLPFLTDRVAGLFTSERGFSGYGISGGAAGVVNIRGVGQGNKVLFMIDGQPQWAAVFGHALPDTYVSTGVERVEVVKGPSSLLYGSNAMGGSVNIVTRRGKGTGLYGRGSAMFGSFNTQRFDMECGWGGDRFRVSGSGHLHRSNGNRSGSAFWVANEKVGVGYGVSDRWSVGGSVDLTQTRCENPGTLQSPLLGMWTYMSRGAASVYLHDRYAWGEGGVQAYINWGHHDVDDGHAPDVAERDYLFHSNDYNMGVTVYQTLRLWEGNALSLGVDYVHWGGHTWDTLKSAGAGRREGLRKSEDEAGGYVMMQQRMPGDFADVNAGVRFQHGSGYGNEWVPQAGFVVRPFGGRLRFCVGKGFRAPNLRELYMYAPANPDLRAERLWSYEVELGRRFAGGRVDVSVSLFFIEGDNMIQLVPVDGKMRNMNVGSFVNKGIEVEGSWQIDGRWRMAANYGYLHSDNSKLLSAPRHKLWCEVVYSPGALSVSASCNGVWGLETGGASKESYTLFNIRGGYTLRKGGVSVRPVMKIDNLFNKHYEVLWGCPMPGITLLGGVEVEF